MERITNLVFLRSQPPNLLTGIPEGLLNNWLMFSGDNMAPSAHVAIVEGVIKDVLDAVLYNFARFSDDLEFVIHKVSQHFEGIVAGGVKFEDLPNNGRKSVVDFRKGAALAIFGNFSAAIATHIPIGAGSEVLIV